MASAPSSRSARQAQAGSQRQQSTAGAMLALLAYFGVMMLLVLVFAGIGFVACTAPVPERVGFFPPL
jgi:hypothetical protein